MDDASIGSFVGVCALNFRHMDELNYQQTGGLSSFCIGEANRHLQFLTKKETQRQADRRTDTQTHRHTDRQKDRQTDRQTHRHTDRQKDRHTPD